MKPIYISPEKATARFDDESNITPFWLSNVMYRESACFIRKGGRIRARLLFSPLRIAAVQSNDLKTTYEEGRDWIWDKKTQALLRPEGSRIGFFEPEELAGANAKPYEAEPAGLDKDTKCARIGNALYCEGETLYGRVFQVTYVYDPAQCEIITHERFRGNLLPKTMKKFRAGEPLRIVVHGDSTHTGADTSSWYKREPFMPGYPELVKRGLHKIYGSNITLINNAVGGTQSGWGVETLEERVLSQNPDLLLLGFGNNDCGQHPIDKIMDNLIYMIQTVQSRLPQCEIILLGPSIANPDSGFIAWSDELAAPQRTLEKEGLAYYNVWRNMASVLAFKDFAAMTGNGIAHPNDWTTRIYSSNLLAMLVDYENL